MVAPLGFLPSGLTAILRPTKEQLKGWKEAIEHRPGSGRQAC